VELNVRLVSETATTITIGWDAPPGQEGYVPTIDGSQFLTDGKRHAGTSKTANQVKIGKIQDGKSHAYGVICLGNIGQGAVWSPPITPPPPPPTTKSVPKYGFSPGYASKTWSDSDHAWVFTKMKEIAQGKEMLWRTETSSASDARCDRDVNACLANGLVPYVIIGGTNHSPSPTCGSYVVQVAEKYKGKGVIYTGPNEPDDNGWSADMLADHCKAIYQAIKAVDPDALVGYAALWKGSPNSFSAWQPFVKSAIARAKGFFDFFPTHCGYDDPSITAASAASWNYWHWLFKRYGTIAAGQTAEELFAVAGIDVPFVCDEGWGKNPYPDAITKMNRILGESKNGHIQTMTIYCVMPDVSGYNHLLNADHTETQGFQPFKTFMASA
jgi:hypothetical protein